jgi:hypothetical protein
MTLDCETFESTEKSLAAVLGIEHSRVRTSLNEFTLDDFQVNADIVDDRWRPMLNTVAGRTIEDFDQGFTHWFHATRVKDFATFHSGIRSLPQQLNETWASLYTFVTDLLTPEQWRSFRTEAERENFGGHSPEVIRAWISAKGPYAFLLAESPLNPRGNGNHDYFATSELVEFIALYFERKFRVSLHARYQAATRPALVKFKTEGIKAAHLGAAFDYLLHRKSGWSLSCLSPCFSGEGRSVSPKQMVKVIPVVETVGRYGRHSTYCLSPSDQHTSLRA